MWTLEWDAGRIAAVLHGHGRAAARYFDANVFHPAPLALAYSDHLTAQAIQALPLLAVTRNPILCYNLLILSTFVLCGLGAFLLVRELTGDALAGFVGGLLFAFAPYRMTQTSQLAALSTEWLPFVLYGATRYMESVTARSSQALRGGRVVPLAGMTAAAIAAALSGADSVDYFTPFVAAFVVWEIGIHRMWTNLRMWIQLLSALLVVTLVVVPFELPYAVLRNALHLEHGRGEVIRHSADVYSYATTVGGSLLWGRLVDAWPKGGVALFPGFVTLVFAAVGLAGARRMDREARPAWQAVVAIALGVIATVYTLAFASVLLWRHVVLDAGAFQIHIGNATQMLLRAVVALVLLCVAWRPARHHAAVLLRTRGFFIIALLAAAWLSLGPEPQALGAPIDFVSPYGVLFDRVSAFRGAGDPARYAAMVTLMLAVLGGFGTALLARHKTTRLCLPFLAIAFLAEGAAMPITLNAQQPGVAVALPEPRLQRPGRAPAIYNAVSALPADAAIAELPLGDANIDSRAMFYGGMHGHSILNGDGEFFPPHYADLEVAVSDVPRHTDVALDALHRLGATHVLVHEAEYLDGTGEKTSAALRQAGATELDRQGTDVLLKLP